MTAWTKETKAIWQRLVLGGMTMDKIVLRASQRARRSYSTTQWYIRLPLERYLNGPFNSKTAAVRYAAEAMELDTCRIEPSPQPRTTKSLPSASRSAA